MKRLSGRGELHLEIARLSGENSKLRRSEARLKSDLIFAQDRVNALLQRLEDERASLMTQQSVHAEQDVRNVQKSHVDDSRVRR